MPQVHTQVFPLIGSLQIVGLVLNLYPLTCPTEDIPTTQDILDTQLDVDTPGIPAVQLTDAEGITNAYSWCQTLLSRWRYYC